MFRERFAFPVIPDTFTGKFQAFELYEMRNAVPRFGITVSI